MNKRYLLPALLLVATILSANPDNMNAQNGAMDIQAEESMQKAKPLPLKTIEIKQQEFRNLNKLIAKMDKLSEREKQNR